MSKVQHCTTSWFTVCADCLLHKRSVMMPVGISPLSHTKLIIIEPVVKINGSYYTLLQQHLLPAICSISGPFFTSQRDNAPAHHAHKTVALLLADMPDFSTGHQTAQISIRLIMWSGEFCRTECIVARFVTLTIWKNSRIASLWSAYHRQTSGYTTVSVRKADILSIRFQLCRC